MFYSTRNKDTKVSASQAILQGLSKDGGLFLPETIPTLKVDGLVDYSYQDLAYKILREYLDDYSDEEIRTCVTKAYGKDNFSEKIFGVTSFDHFSFLELFHGNTLTFKDMALSLLPHLMEVAIKKNHIQKKMMILTATSGDTGSAALNAFNRSRNIEIKVFYPEGGISLIQEKQMLSFTTPTARAYALQSGNFDDCQAFVKSILSKGSNQYNLTSANSINVGRLLPQIVYYYASYLSLVKSHQISLNDKIDVVVPTGNFGNIFACYLSKLMGLPLDRIICASNENRVLTDFFATGKYTIHRDFVKTNSPSMDILISSNLERLLYLFSSDSDVRRYMDDLKNKGEFELDSVYQDKLHSFEAYSVNQVETLDYIKSCYEENHYLIDPHTAVSYGAYKMSRHENHTLIVSTASPYKFPETILKAFHQPVMEDTKALYWMDKNTNTRLPLQLKKRVFHDIPSYPVKKDEVEKVVFSKKTITVKAPCSSANLGPGYDVCGVALNRYNTFTFRRNERFELLGFNGKDLKDNLVQKSYEYFFEKMEMDMIPATISLDKQEIFYSRGLGSSASCIVAGLMAANEMVNRLVSKDELLKMAVELEGHPDNVAPALLGGFRVTYHSANGYHSISYPVSPELKFILCVPDQPLETVKARAVLPSSLSYGEIVNNISHAINLPKGVMEGNLDLLFDVMKDSLHTPYRIGLIPHGKEILALAEEKHLPSTISGAGSTLLILSKDEEIITELKKKDFDGYHYYSLSVDVNGALVEEE